MSDGRFQKGIVPWNKGLKNFMEITPEYRKKIIDGILNRQLKPLGSVEG
jgi:hypothetical protein